MLKNFKNQKVLKPFIYLQIHFSLYSLSKYMFKIFQDNDYSS